MNTDIDPIPTWREGYLHEAVYYSTDEELLGVAVPFLTGGASAGMPTVVALGERTGALVRAALPADADVTFLPGGDMYARPAAAIRAYRDMLASYRAAGAGQIRIIGEVPRAALGATWDWWARYEAAINRAYDDFPLWSLCAYDTRITPPPVLVDVGRTHPHAVAPDGRHVPSATFTDPVAYLSEARPMVPDPVQREAPIAELADPTPADARHAVYAAANGRLPAGDVEGLVIAVSEAVTNALRHGRPPSTVRVWAGPDRIVVEVRDAGTGVQDPFAGLLPARGDPAGGLGLWIAHQSCNHVVADRSAGAFTLRLTAGNPHF